MAGPEGLPWPEGSVGAIRGAAGDIRSLLGSLHDARSTLSQVSTPANGWTGDAAYAYGQMADRHLVAIDAAANHIQIGGEELDNLADALDEAQDRIRRWARRVRDARLEAERKGEEERLAFDRLVAARAAATPDPLLGAGLGSLDPADRELASAELDYGVKRAAAEDARTRHAELRGEAIGEAEIQVERVEEISSSTGDRLRGLDFTAAPWAATAGGGPDWTDVDFECPLDDPAYSNLLGGLAGAMGRSNVLLQAIKGRPLRQVLDDDIDGAMQGQVTDKLNEVANNLTGGCKPGDFPLPDPPPPPPPPPKPWWQTPIDVLAWPANQVVEGLEDLGDALPAPEGPAPFPAPPPLPRPGPG